MHIAEPRASNSSLRTLYACESQVCKAVLDGATCLTTREEGFIVTHRGSVTPGTCKCNTKTLHLYSSIAGNQSAESVALYRCSVLNITVLESRITVTI